MYIEINQTGDNNILKIEGEKVIVENYEISDTLDGKILTVEIPLNKQDMLLEEKAESSQQKEPQKDNNKEEPGVQINITAKNGMATTQVKGNSREVAAALTGTLACVMLDNKKPGVPLDIIANDVRDYILLRMRQMERNL